MKRISVIILLLAVLCFSFVSCSADDFELFTGNTEVSFKIENGEAIVTLVPNKSVVTSVVIPDEYEGVPVTKIADFSAVNLEYVTKITIGKNVKEISDWAFGNSKKIEAFEVDGANKYICDVDGVIYTKDMKTIMFYPPARDVEITTDAEGNEVKSISYEIPEGVETIRTKAFYKCSELINIVIPSTVKTIEEKAFFGCDLQTLILPEALEIIGKDAFCFNGAISELTIPQNVNQIDEFAFMCCGSLVKIDMHCKESEVTLGKKWYPTDNGAEYNVKPVINWING